ncbi:MAG: hypothetical protein ACLRTD_24805 [Bacteroides sp.]
MEWEQIPNIEMVTDGKLASICPHTGRGDTLFFFFDGGVAHGAVPLVYDLTGIASILRMWKPRAGDDSENEEG